MPSPSDQADPETPRRDDARAWVSRQLGGDPSRWEPITGDASFRQYTRTGSAARPCILMDAPPDREDTGPFIEVARRLLAAGIRAPRLIAADREQGYLLLEDFGDTLLRERLDASHPEAWFPALFDLLERLATVPDANGLPPYDRSLLQTELELFPGWYLARHCGIDLDCDALDTWEQLSTRLIRSARQQPQVFVHRDFHSCNLMVLDDGSLGVIDFQDAVCGPLSYDFVSLLWDRYIHWPRDRIEQWMETYRARVAPGTDSQTWARWCDWMGLQRNLKVVGIFARLCYRDGKTAYLDLIPPFWTYVNETVARYPEFDEFRLLLERLRCAP